MVGLLSRLARPRRTEVIVECRRCGTTVDDARTTCPTCGQSGFAEYRLHG